MVDKIYVKGKRVIKRRHDVHSMQGNSAQRQESGEREPVNGIGLGVISSHIV